MNPTPITTPGAEAEALDPTAMKYSKPKTSTNVPSVRTRYALLTVIVLMLASVTAVALNWIQQIEAEFKQIHANLLASPGTLGQDQPQIHHSEFVPSDPQS